LLPFAHRRSCRTAARQTGLSLRAQNPMTGEFTVCGLCCHSPKVANKQRSTNR
jgi:hypothetical protein